MPLLESAAVAIAVEVGSRGYDWIRDTSATANIPLQAAQVATQGTELEPAALRTGFARAQDTTSSQAFMRQPREKIVYQVSNEIDYDCDANLTAIVDTYLDELENRLAAEDDGEAIILEYLRHIQQDVTDLRTDIKNQRYYRVFQASETTAAVEYLQDQLDHTSILEYVARPEIPEQLPQKCLIVGRKGIGKSRTVFNCVEQRLTDEEIESVLIPSRAVQRPKDIQAAFTREYTGDLLLVWDDIHELNSNSDQNAFYEAILKLEEILDDEQSLHVIATSRSERQRDLPNYAQWTEDPVWQAFEQVKLKPLDEDTLTNLLDNALDAFELTLTDQARESFIQIVASGAPSPFYIMSACAYLASQDRDRDEVSATEITSLPPVGLEVWKEQYDYLRDTHEIERYILTSIKLLTTVSAPIERSLIRGVFSEVLDQHPIDFDAGLQTLIDQQWITLGRADDQVNIHTIQLEAIDEELELFYEDFVSYLLNNSDSHIGLDVAVGLSMNLAVEIMGNPDIQDESLVRDIAERFIEEGYIEQIDSQTQWMFHCNYAGYLYNQMEFESAIKQTTRAIQAAPDEPTGYVNHALIAERLSESGVTDGAFRRAVEVARDREDRDATPVLLRRASYLHSQARDDAAQDLYEEAIKISNNEPHVLQRYAEFLVDINQIGQARILHQQATQQAENITVILNYVEFLRQHGPQSTFETMRDRLLAGTPESIDSVDQVHEAQLAHQRQFVPETHNQPIISESDQYKLLNHANELADTEGPQEAVEWLQDQADEYVDFPIYLHLGQLHAKAGNRADAVDAIEDAIDKAVQSLHPGKFVDLVIDFGILLEENDFDEAALEIYDYARETLDGDGEAFRAAQTKMLRHRADLNATEDKESLILPFILGKQHIFAGDIENALNCFLDTWEARTIVDDEEIGTIYAVKAGILVLALIEIASQFGGITGGDVATNEVETLVNEHIDEVPEYFQEVYSEIQLQEGDTNPILTNEQVPDIDDVPTPEEISNSEANREDEIDIEWQDIYVTRLMLYALQGNPERLLTSKEQMIS